MTRFEFLNEIHIHAEGFADHFDELPLWSSPFGLMLLDEVPLGPTYHYVDIGAGTGFLSIELAERSGVQSRVYAVDPWKEALGRLRRKLESRSLTNVVIVEQNADTLPIADQSIDVVVSNLGINNFEDPKQVLLTAHRVLKPQGHLVLTTNLVGHMAELYEVFASVLIECNLRDCLSEFEKHIAHRGTVESITSLLESAGFVVTKIRTDQMRLRYCNGSAFLRHYFVRLGFMQAWKQLIPKDQVMSFFARLEEQLNERSRRQGELGMTIPMACIVTIPHAR
jgi:ubiquinone/menaquinone biosynthesis C-methylase UbiE